MTSRGGGAAGRDRFRRETALPSRMEEMGGGGGGNKRGNNPPSRHLWVGNLSHSIGENDLTYHFLKFGELESVAFQPGRSYAFVNFVNDEDAIDALKALQGFPLAGNPLRIEFAKAEKSTQSRDEDNLLRRDERAALRGSPFSQRDLRARNASPDSFYPDKTKMNDRTAEASEVLWIGFPALLKVDEMILRKAFSPFGEIEKITVFPGRSYAFVRFRSIMSACRAKETLQGKLFGNPRVNICFAKSEVGSSHTGRIPLSPNLKSNSRTGDPENFRRDRNFASLTADPGIRSPQFVSSMDPGDPNVYGFKRKDTMYVGGSDTFDNIRFGDQLGPPQDMYEHHGSPTRERDAHLHEFSQNFSRNDSPFEEPWDLPEDSHLFHRAKRLKAGSFPPDKDLPEYPFSDIEQEKNAYPRALADFSQSEHLSRNFESGPFGYKTTPDRTISVSLPYGERSNRWKASHNNFQSISSSVPSNHAETKRFTPEPEQSLKLWKWEGTIAKGGTPVCRARCFPVGKILDVMLPEFLDCTARTGLDMLAKHYYQAASAWVVFFVPASDADMGYYNEFMHYLGEKQRAAVAKLDDKTTLFLVPPSDFSEKVLKVPGKLSISGVILNLEHPGSNSGPPNHLNERRDTNLSSFHGDAQYQKFSTPSSHYPSTSSFPDSGKSRGGPSFLGNVGNISDAYNESRQDFSQHQRNHLVRPDWSPHHPQNFDSGDRNVPSHASNTAVDAAVEEHRSVLPRRVQEYCSSPYVAGLSSNPLSASNKLSIQERKPSVSLPVASLQPQQLVQLASTLLGQQSQSGSNLITSVGDDFRQTNARNQSDNQYRTSRTHMLQNNQMGTEIPTAQFGQLHQLQASSGPTAVPPKVQIEQSRAQGNPPTQSTSTQEDADADPQKRLQATLQLAAALLQQIQQGKGS